MPKFSIIIPCYNCFHLMKGALESLENQTFQDFEVLIIDDSSTDDSFEKLKQYQQSSKLNMALFQNAQNLGAGRTRNIGLQNATGKFVTFMDADDLIENNMLEVLNQIFESEKADCVIFDYFLKTKNNLLKQKSLFKVPKGQVSKSDALIYSTGSTWGKAYLLNKIKNNKIEFPNLIRGEDMPFNKLAISVCDVIYYCNKPLYYYIENKESLMHNDKLLNEQYAIEAYALLENKLKDEYYHEIEAIFLKEYLYATTMTLVAKKVKAKQIKKHIQECLKRYPNVYQNEAIEGMTTYQKLCLIAIRLKIVWLMKIVLLLKRFIKKIR